MNPIERGRRRFLKESAALAGLAVGAVGSASGQTPGTEKQVDPKTPYGERSRFVSSARTAREYPSHTPYPSRIMDAADALIVTPLQDSAGIITPSPLHFVVYNAGYGYPRLHPDIDPRQHRLLIHGLVDRPLIFTMEELQRLPSVSRTHFLECGGNSRNSVWPGTQGTVQQNHGLTSCSEWTGVPLSLLLREAGVQKEASWVHAEGADAHKHSRSFPLEKGMDDVLVAYAQNGEPIRPENGYPVRLVIPGIEGNRSVKWLRRIKVADQPYTSWSSFAAHEQGVKSVITFPSGGQRLPGPGFYEITGLAWSGGGAIRRVEVSTDGGRTWKDARLQEPVFRKAHTRFRLDWTWKGEEAVLQSRCTDERGDVQPTLAELSRIHGVDLDWWRSTSVHFSHFRPIFPWKVTREGSVHNAMY